MDIQINFYLVEAIAYLFIVDGRANTKIEPNIRRSMSKSSPTYEQLMLQ